MIFKNRNLLLTRFIWKNLIVLINYLSAKRSQLQNKFTVSDLSLIFLTKKCWKTAIDVVMIASRYCWEVRAKYSGSMQPITAKYCKPSSNCSFDKLRMFFAKEIRWQFKASKSLERSKLVSADFMIFFSRGEIKWFG